MNKITVDLTNLTKAEKAQYLALTKNMIRGVE